MMTGGIAKKYGKALFREAQAQKQLRACQQGLEELVHVVGKQLSLVSLMDHPFVPMDRKQKMLKAALGEYSTPLLERFVSLLVEKKQFASIQSIHAAFQTEVDASEGVQRVSVKTATDLGDAEKKQLQKALETALKTKIRMDVAVDPQLLAGFVARAADVELDGSLRNQLERLKKELVG